MTLIDTDAFRFFFRIKAKGAGGPLRVRSSLHAEEQQIAEQVAALMVSGEGGIHPITAGEVFLSGVDPYDAFAGMDWLPPDQVPSDYDTLTWLGSFGAGNVRKVGWSDSKLVHTAVLLGLDVLSGDRGVRALLEQVRSA